ncbi:hypothetical protein QE435_004738 [Rhizobium sp. SORGH_AS 787]|nr:hypothetical protein [Rhizobium sp. SORGH_AS_0787]
MCGIPLGEGVKESYLSELYGRAATFAEICRKPKEIKGAAQGNSNP